MAIKYRDVNCVEYCMHTSNIELFSLSIITYGFLRDIICVQSTEGVASVGRVTLDMHAPIKRRKKRGRLYFSSIKALTTSRMGKKKVAPERYETSGINKV